MPYPVDRAGCGSTSPGLLMGGMFSRPAVYVLPKRAKQAFRLPNNGNRVSQTRKTSQIHDSL